MRSKWWLLVFLLPACAPGGGDDDSAVGDDDDTPSYVVDPDVDSYWPDDHAPSAPARVIFLGDSITAGSGASAGLAYPDLLVANVSTEWPEHDEIDLQSLYPDLDEVIDVSVGGATTASLLANQLPDLSGRVGESVVGQSIVVFTIGGNDMQGAMFDILANGAPAAQEAIASITGNLHSILDYFDDASRFPDGAYVHLSNVYEPTDAQGQVSSCFFGIDLGDILEHFDAANAAIRGVAVERGAAMVDLRGHFLGHGYFHDDEAVAPYHPDDPTLWFAPDCIHPNERGHHELRRLFHSVIANRELPLEPVPE
jgi:hypothetical protein